ncbi:MAG: nucleotide exchange factor GrpE [Dysgonamonadaceae bacterium]|jgi:molecular chaperone GrpE|nr:nucleotide exchange factor GrpE [Dysgonamonadaceae bacterium]
MNKHSEQEKPEIQTDLSDNITDETTKEQSGEAVIEENREENPDNTDSMSEELEKLKDSYVRLMAEYDNYRKRTIKEKADLIKNGGEKTLIGLLPVIDDFERARQTIETATDIEALKEGVELIYNKFLSYLQQNGVKTINTAEQSFDADLHEAIAMTPATEESQKGNIIDTVQTGYMLNDKVIRHAKVVVAN